MALNDTTLRIGKIYEVRDPQKAQNLGFARTIKITGEKNGGFVGHTDEWYQPNGICSMGQYNYLDLVKEVSEMQWGY
ncbi:hypothetical protein LZG74_16840 [Dyadobacter sp. CY327]|uniref:hypothetical protein n=1 Tax=Dyadobacter sp. CY327 TaxID=2907301 RepID=UPI001F232E4D|nr:hypothetical protein [Dyadobacter sp. CY327]MCE7071985.1 hypothetical protein [Dyadobacter sp. CY327]